jgi:hypothetical protein
MSDDWQVIPGPGDHGEAAFAEEVLRDDPDLLAKISSRVQETLAEAYDRTEDGARFSAALPFDIIVDGRMPPGVAALVATDHDGKLQVRGIGIGP